MGTSLRFHDVLIRAAASATLLVPLGCADDNTGDTAGQAGGAGEINGAAAVGVEVQIPFDATPTPDADAVYFTAVNGDTAGVFKVPKAGGAPEMITAGFNAPVSLVISPDGATLYVADLALTNEEPDASKPGGGLFAVAATGGEAVLLTPTTNYSPRSLDITADGGDVVYFTGRDPTEGIPGVYRFPVDADAVETLYSGVDLVEPSGIAVTSDGDVYIVDAIGVGGAAGLLRVSNGAVEPVSLGLKVGYPAGIALSADESVILVSGLNASTGGAQVYRIVLGSDQAPEIIDMGISQNTESAGLHRAYNVDQYAWADANAPGTVYLIGTKARPL